MPLTLKDKRRVEAVHALVESSLGGARDGSSRRALPGIVRALNDGEQ